MAAEEGEQSRDEAGMMSRYLSASLHWTLCTPWIVQQETSSGSPDGEVGEVLQDVFLRCMGGLGCLGCLSNEGQLSHPAHSLEKGEKFLLQATQL